jgi:hypothetical protein
MAEAIIPADEDFHVSDTMLTKKRYLSFDNYISIGLSKYIFMIEDY